MKQRQLLRRRLQQPDSSATSSDPEDEDLEVRSGREESAEAPSVRMKEQKWRFVKARCRWLGCQVDVQMLDLKMVAVVAVVGDVAA